MNDLKNIRYPRHWAAIEEDGRTLQFNMASEPLIGSLLRTLAATKPGARFLELGTGTGLSTAWLLEGMSQNASLVTVDNDPDLLAVAQRHLGHDPRLSIVCEDGDVFVQGLAAAEARFDFIFADTWAGKYRFLDETLSLLNPHGLYIIDDMLPQPNWPEDHPPKVAALLQTLEQRTDLHISKLSWSCGAVICTKKA